jgi:hypothetical protein
MRAIMCAALPHDQALDRCATIVTGIPISLINLEIILKLPAPVHPIDAGTIALDAF